jgi:hypothetical protein
VVHPDQRFDCSNYLKGHSQWRVPVLITVTF